VFIVSAFCQEQRSVVSQPCRRVRVLFEGYIKVGLTSTCILGNSRNHFGRLYEKKPNIPRCSETIGQPQPHIVISRDLARIQFDNFRSQLETTA
jgi:hypothetical protein